MVDRDYLFELFNYNPDTGEVTRRCTKKFCSFKVGDPVGSVESHGYLQVKIDGKLYLLHRIIYFMLHNEWPDVVDHIDGNRLNNSANNLRASTKQSNSRNRKGVDGLTSIYKGVSLHKKTGKWSSNICYKYKLHYLGLFDTQEAAAIEYNRKATELFGEFARLNIIEVS